MIGDSALDMEMAIAIGVDAIGVDFYGGQEDGLRVAGARAVFTDSRQIADFLGLKTASHTRD
jgi:phosphoglycolate phosphatase-like HAD superfamily hydrolase